MREFEFIPDSESELEGRVKLSVPSFDQRMTYLELSGFEYHPDMGLKSSNTLKSITKMVELSKPHYLEVALKRKEDGQEFKSFEDMAYDPSCDGVLCKIAQMIAEGVRVPKKSKPS